MNQTIYFLFHRLVLVATTSIIGVAIESEIVSILTSSKFCVCIPVRIFPIFDFGFFGWMSKLLTCVLCTVSHKHQHTGPIPTSYIIRQIYHRIN